MSNSTVTTRSDGMRIVRLSGAVSRQKESGNFVLFRKVMEPCRMLTQMMGSDYEKGLGKGGNL